MIEQFSETSLDEFLGGQVRLYQPSSGFRAGQDSVLAAATVPVKEGQHVLDMGAGAGAITMSLLAREKTCRVTALEIQPAYADLLRQSASMNDVESSVTILQEDVHKIGDQLPDGGFDHVVMNPPFYDVNSTKAPDPGRALARHADDSLPESWIRYARRYLKPRGYLTLVYAAEFVPLILSALQTGFGGVELFPIWPGPGKPGKTILVRARKNVKSPFRLHQGLCLRDADARPTAIANAILRDGLSLDDALKQFDNK